MGTGSSDQGLTGMPFADMVTVLTDLYMDFSETDGWRPWLKTNYLGVSMAVLIYNDAATPTQLGVGLVEKAWTALLTHLEVDKAGRWDDLYALLEDAANRS